MRSLFNNDGLELVIGIDWQQFVDIKKATASLKNNASSHLVCGAVIGEDYVSGSIASDRKGRFYAAALAISYLYDSIIIVKKLDDDTVWVCGIDGAQPLAGMDVIVPAAEVSDVVSRILSCVKAPTIVGDHSAATVSWEDVLALLDKNSLSKALMSRSDNVNKKSIIAFGAALSLCGIAAIFYAYSTMSHSQPEFNSQSVSQQQALAAAMAAEQSAELFKGPAIIRMMDLWTKTLNGLPLSHEGWSPVNAFCVPSECNVEWQRQPYALPSAVATLPGERVQVTSDTATTRFPIGLPALAITNRPVDKLDTYLIDLAVFVPALSVTPATGERLAVLPPSFEGIPAPLIARSGTFRAAASSTLMLSHIVQKIDHPGVQIDSLAVTGINTLGNSTIATIEGAYYVKP